MGTQNRHGFTIVETMLFLAVTGLLILGMVAATGATLSIQRYRDASETFKALLQQQYADLRDVQNGRSVHWSCGADAVPVEDALEQTILGQGDCVFVGKYMTVNGSDVNIYPVLAYEKSKTPRATDIDTFKLNYTIAASQTEIESKTMEWGTQIAWPASGSGAKTPTTPRTIGILFLRSPVSGSMYTFTSDQVPSNKADVQASLLLSMIVPGNAVPGQSERTLCINSGNFLAEGDRSVYIGNFASSASAIETRTNDFIKSSGGSTQC